MGPFEMVLFSGREKTLKNRKSTSVRRFSTGLPLCRRMSKPLPHPPSFSSNGVVEEDHTPELNTKKVHGLEEKECLLAGYFQKFISQKLQKNWT